MSFCSLTTVSSTNSGLIRSAIKVLLEIPNAPTSITAVAGNTQATVSWTASTIGLPITSYRVQYSSNSGTSWTTFGTTTSNTSLIVTGLTNGTSYIFQVAASNSNGFGTWSSSSSSVTPNVSSNSKTWTTSNPVDSNQLWLCISASLDGTKLIVCRSGNLLYRSTDSGGTWSTLANSGNRTWRCVLSSSDGSTLLGGVSGGLMYRSIDSGANWTSVIDTTNRSWHYMRYSPGYTRIIASVYNGLLYISNDHGLTWNSTGTTSRRWTDVAISDDGTKIFGCTDGVGIWFSLNSGTNWSQVSNGIAFYSISIFNNGNGFISGGSNGSVYMTTNTSNLSTVGLTEVTALKTTSADWRCAASSSDGTYLVVGDFSGTTKKGIYISNNSGSSWVQQTSTSNLQHLFITNSLNFQNIFSAVYGGRVLIGT